MFDLTEKTVLVTGASGGIGAEIAKTLHARGAVVGLSGTRKEALDALAVTLGDRVHVLPCNLGSAEDVEQLIPAATEAMGGIDILVNNAGLTRDGLILRMKDEDWDQVIAVNLSAAFRLCRAVAKPMMKKRAGRIINITSIVGHTGNPGQANYCASKGGMTAMSKSLAQELASRGITVNCVAPGFIETAMTDKLSDDQKAKLNAGIPAGRMGTPEDIAAAVVFLASDESAYITGQTLHVNGGMAMI
ncbi:3-oxoacyl-[acyl-carrier protein] reductase [Caenispirillum salinarum AK4]|uniref:3-oxoacyl-[acyl-carrier-protein] reductase n=1 Tax=Caenispirillum salinarum AK4 TaxID=1238182 RepID=K9GY49_9PROT|nr:3-oxoacyl-[acyl-carrier-protein] reductase [Caenispirillum salinarum]EKV30162.1 3-oxoacyl-[acyl-carrier protein] reductase [Caenispirillum salinarum AK4]